MTNYIHFLDNLARELHAIILSQSNLTEIPTEDWGWENYRYSSDKFRLAHIEIFNQDRFMVVHCCVFPHADDTAPIFGFDVIAGENKVTGVFLDLSPTNSKPLMPFSNITINKQRERPEWGDIFSDHWIAARPDEAEMQLIADEAKQVLTNYLTTLQIELGDVAEITIGQNIYCEKQSQNEHTFRALKNIIGEAAAKTFMTQVLFPQI